MKKFLSLILALCMLFSLSVLAFAEEAAEEEVVPVELDMEALMELEGQVLEGGSRFTAIDCAFNLNFTLMPEEESAEALDAMLEAIEADMATANLAPMEKMGEDMYAYSAMPMDEFGPVMVVPLYGEPETIKDAVEKVRALRYATESIIPEEMAGTVYWMVSAVEEIDYYEEEGQQYPCLIVQLAPADEAAIEAYLEAKEAEAE